MDEQADGSLLVYGKATDDTLDSDEQVCDPIWLSSAMPDWFKWGNIREQHSSIAAGVATEYKAEGSEHFITAHIVDPGSVAKCKAGVLKGFSIGIRRPRVIKDNKAAGGRIVDGQIVEVSIVDRPANPACTLTVAKTINSQLVQVEELTESEGNEVKQVTATEIIEMAKGYVSVDSAKFDQGAFDDARRALATLIQVEAGELAEGSDEVYSIACLLNAVHSLLEWHEGEAAEGEVAPLEEVAESIEMSDEAEALKDDAADIEMCSKCDKEMKDCKCAEGGFVAEEKTITPVAPEFEDGVEEEETPDNTVYAEAEPQAEKSLTLDEIREVIVDTVKSLLPTTVGENVVTKANESERIEALETELAQVKALAAPSGPKRMNAVGSTSSESPAKKAQEYRAKAASTNDKKLAQGYLDLARDLEKNTTTS